MSSFRAFQIIQEDGKVQGRLADVDLADLCEGEVVVQVAYSGVNYKDALAATGAAKVVRRFPLVGGIDLAGTVASSDDPRFSEGDPVLVTGFGLGESHDGGYAKYARVPADWVVPLPEQLSLFEAMALGTAGFTAALSLVEMERNGLAPTDGPVVVTGATGGVGSLAVQCLAARGYRVTAVTRKDDAHDFLRALGRDGRSSGQPGRDGHTSAREIDLGRRRRPGRGRYACLADPYDAAGGDDRQLGPDGRYRAPHDRDAVHSPRGQAIGDRLSDVPHRHTPRGLAPPCHRHEAGALRHDGA